MKLTKKLIAVVLSVIMIFSMIAAPVSATETITENSKVEEVVETVDTVLSLVGKIMDFVHNLVGGIMGMLDKECPFCGEVHVRDAEGEEPNEEGCYTITFDFNYESAPTPIHQNVNAGDYATIIEAPSREGYEFIGWYQDGNDDEQFNFHTQKIEKNIVLIAKWYDLSDETDTDNDDLPDQIENYFGTDISKDDTDGDGLTDYVERIILALNPVIKDTDYDTICDGDEDSDSDGLNNKTEVTIGSSPISKDTDNDGLSDAEEGAIETNPCLKDTDSDGVSDKKELELGTDPLVAQSVFDITAKCTDSSSGVSASVDICLPGEQAETLSVTEVNDDDLFPTSMPGYLGKAYEFNVEGTFSSATIKFEFDETKLSSESVPTIYYFNELEQSLEQLETVVEGNVAKAVTTHFSKYILLDRTVYEDSFTWIDVWDSTKNYTNAEIILVIDDSGSLGGDYGYNSSLGTFTGGKDPEHKRLEVAKNFIDNANSNAKIGIVKFDGVVDNMSNGLISCTKSGKDELKSCLKFTYVPSGDYNQHSIFDSRGYTNMYTGIENAVNQLSSNKEETLKVIVVLTDGIAQDTDMHNSVISKAISKGIKIYTVGLGTSSEYFSNYLIPLANKTGGAFYNASDAGQLSTIYDNISQKIDIETDSDRDGIPDYYEDHLLTFAGVSVVLDKNNPDTDNDGYSDGEEVELKYEYNADKSKVKVICKIISNPDKKRSFSTVAYDIPKDKVLNDINMNIQEIHPLLGLSSTMMELSTDASNMLENVPVALDAFSFICSWIENSNSITQLNVTTSKDNKMTIKYGSSIELNLSGKKTTLDSLIVDRYYSYSPSIIFSANKKADECIRNWFGLSGNGTYSMTLDFGRVYIGEYGYYLLYENGEFYQVPIIHKDTTMYVYYKEGKEVTKLFDAATILRGVRIKLSAEEKGKVLEQLKKNGFEPR